MSWLKKLKGKHPPFRLPLSWVVLFWFIYIGLEVFIRVYFLILTSSYGNTAELKLSDTLGTMHAIVIVMGPILFGGIRILRVHPLLIAGYFDSFRTLPDTLARNSIVAPPWFVWGDVKYVCIAALLSVHVGIVSGWGLMQMLGTLTGMVLLSLLGAVMVFMSISAKNSKSHYAKGVLLVLGTLSAVLLTWRIDVLWYLGIHTIWLYVVGLVVAYGYGVRTMRQEIEAGVWLDEGLISTRLVELKKSLFGIHLASYPANQLLLTRLRIISGLGMFLNALALSVWAYFFIHLFAEVMENEVGEVESFMRNTFFGFSLLPLYALVHRLILYKSGYAAPISMTGRLATGRLIIRGYDFIYLMPILAIVLWMVSWMVSKGVGLSLAHLDVWLSITLFTSLMILGWNYPNLEEWQLTGDHRIRPASMIDTIEKMSQKRS